jgi:death-on-curing protein
LANNNDDDNDKDRSSPYYYFYPGPIIDQHNNDKQQQQYQDLTVDEILNIHLEVEAKFPTIYRGVQKPGLLESIATRPSQKHYNQEHFPDIYSKCASLIEAIIQWHPFFDGNKRTGLLVAFSYMYKNRFMFMVPIWAVRFSVLIADHKRNLQDIRRWVQVLSADNADEYFAKHKRYMLDPVDKILSLIDRGNKENDAAAHKRAQRIMDNWLAVDIYPEYKIEDVETIEFLEYLSAKFDRFPFY